MEYGCAALAPGALVKLFIICLYNGLSFGCSVATLARTAFAKAGVGMFVRKVFGRTKRNPSVSKKQKVLSLITGPPTEVAHWFAFERGFAVPPLLNIQSLAFMVEPFHQYSAFPWKLLVPDLVKEMTWAPANWSNSAEYGLATTVASWISLEPIVMLVAPELLILKYGSMSFSPLTVNKLAVAGMPFTVKFP